MLTPNQLPDVVRLFWDSVAVGSPGYDHTDLLDNTINS